MPQDKEKAILKITQEMIRRGGYNGFSFRNIAAAVGIKSSSVHYHYPTKEDLAVAAAQNYTNEFIDNLGEPADIVAQGGNPIESYVDAFRNVVLNKSGMCLCGVLAAEADNLPERVVAELNVFFEKNVEWLKNAYTAIGNTNNIEAKAVQTLSSLQGALVVANAGGNIEKFNLSVAHILDDTTGNS